MCLAGAACFDVNMSDARFRQLLKGGSFMGFMTYDEFWRHINDLLADEQNARFLSRPTKFGSTFEGNDLRALYVTDDSSQLDSFLRHKNIVYVNSMHHAREPLSLTMILLIVRELLLSLRSPLPTKFKEFFKDNVLFLVPVVNTDSYLYITRNYKRSSNREEVLMIRKNRHIAAACGPLTGGVDLNRNYSFKFGLNESGSSSDPCAEDYRGEYPFSEPETAAIKRYLDSHPNVVSGINIHTYGNTWIYPYNFIADKSDQYLKQKKPLFFNFFKEFEREMKDKKFQTIFGNSAFTLDYPTNGEAGDWLLDEKNIINLDVELGNLDERSNQFYPPAEIHDQIVIFNWSVMREFFYRHIVDLQLKRLIKTPKKGVYKFEIFNKSLSSLKNFSGILSPIFKLNSRGYKPEHTIAYTIKDGTGQRQVPIPVIGKTINTTLKGRHTLVIIVKTGVSLEIDLLDSIQLRIKRNFPNKQYEDQKYRFSTSSEI